MNLSNRQNTVVLHSKPPCIECVGWYAQAFLIQHNYTQNEKIN